MKSHNFRHYIFCFVKKYQLGRINIFEHIPEAICTFTSIDFFNKKQHDSVPTKRQETINRKNASPRARVEHVFGYCEQSVHGMFSRAVSFARNAARNILTSLVYNMMRYEQIQRLGMN